MRQERWFELGERGAYWGLSFAGAVYRVLGRTVCRIVLTPAVIYFYLTGHTQRRASSEYLLRAHAMGWLARKPGPGAGLRHFLSFAFGALDTLEAWTGRLKASDLDGLDRPSVDAARRLPGGALLITAHVGNPDVMRAVATLSRHRGVTVLVHTIHAERFNRLIARMTPEAPVKLIQVTQIDIGVAMRLAEAAANGEWVVITGDRIAVNDGEASSTLVDFMGGKARLPIGPYVLASALKCPVYTLFCPRRGSRYLIEMEQLADQVSLPRGDRATVIRGLAQTYAGRLERTLAKAPFQWFNFYDYWTPANASGPRENKA